MSRRRKLIDLDAIAAAPEAPLHVEPEVKAQAHDSNSGGSSLAAVDLATSSAAMDVENQVAAAAGTALEPESSDKDDDNGLDAVIKMLFHEDEGEQEVAKTTADAAEDAASKAAARVMRGCDEKSRADREAYAFVLLTIAALRAVDGLSSEADAALIRLETRLQDWRDAGIADAFFVRRLEEMGKASLALLAALLPEAVTMAAALRAEEEAAQELAAVDKSAEQDLEDTPVQQSSPGREPVPSQDTKLSREEQEEGSAESLRKEPEVEAHQASEGSAGLDAGAGAPPVDPEAAAALAHARACSLLFYLEDGDHTASNHVSYLAEGTGLRLLRNLGAGYYVLTLGTSELAAMVLQMVTGGGLTTSVPESAWFAVPTWPGASVRPLLEEDDALLEQPYVCIEDQPPLPQESAPAAPGGPPKQRPAPGASVLSGAKKRKAAELMNKWKGSQREHG